MLFSAPCPALLPGAEPDLTPALPSSSMPPSLSLQIPSLVSVSQSLTSHGVALLRSQFSLSRGSRRRPSRLPAPSGPLPAFCLQRPCRRPSPGPALPLPGRAVAEAEADSDGAGRGRRPSSPRRRRLGPRGRWGWGRAGSRVVRVPAPGPPGPGPDGLHREPGVLRGARASALLRPAAPRDSAGPRAARAL